MKQQSKQFQEDIRQISDSYFSVVDNLSMTIQTEGLVKQFPCSYQGVIHDLSRSYPRFVEDISKICHEFMRQMSGYNHVMKGETNYDQ